MRGGPTGPGGEGGGLDGGPRRGNPQSLARAHAEGIWIAGEEPLLTRYRQRYFTEALPALSVRDARGERLARRLADLLFPVTSTRGRRPGRPGGARAGGLTGRLRTILQAQEAEFRTAAEVRAA